MARWKILPIVGFLTLIAIVSGAQTFGYLTFHFRTEFGKFISPIGLVISLLGIPLMLYVLWKAPSNILTLTPEGIKDTRVSSDLIPWRQVAAIDVKKIDHLWQILLVVNRASELHLSKYYRGFAGDADIERDRRTFNIAPQGLNINRSTLEELIRDYKRAHNWEN